VDDSAWEHLSLTAEQQQYAATDAYLPLVLYHRLSTFLVPKHLPSTLIPLTPVLVYSTNNTIVIGCGHLSSNLHMNMFDGVNLTKTRMLVDIQDVLVPRLAAIISTHGKRLLQSFGATPFSLVCLWSHVQIYDPLTFNLPGTPNLMVQPSPDNTFLSGSASVIDVDQHSSHPQATSSEDISPDTSQADADDSTSDGVGSLLQSTLDGENSELSNSDTLTLSNNNCNVNLESRACGNEILANVAEPVTWDTAIQS